MDDKRETKEITTPSGHKVVLNSYITGREKRAITNVFLEKAEMTMVGNTPNISGIKGDVANLAEDKTIEIMVVSVDGSTDGILDKVLNLPAKDYDFIVSAINEMTGKKKDEDK